MKIDTFYPNILLRNLVSIYGYIALEVQDVHSQGINDIKITGVQGSNALHEWKELEKKLQNNS